MAAERALYCHTTQRHLGRGFMWNPPFCTENGGIQKQVDGLVCCSIWHGSMKTWCARTTSSHSTCLTTQKGVDGWKTEELCWIIHIQMYFPLSHKASYRNVNIKKIQCTPVYDSLRHFAHLTSTGHNRKAWRRDFELLDSRNDSTRQQPPVKQPHSCSKVFQLVTHPREEPSASKSASISHWCAYSLHLAGYRCKQHSRLLPSKKLA